MADIDLPVFSFVPNWKSGVTETLEWLTDVQRGALGHEQRRSLRLTPRRIFDARFNPIDSVRSFLSLWLQSFGEKTFLLPLWHDQAELSADANEAATRLEFDNTYREFATGGFALLRRDTFTYEVVQIDGQDDDGLDLIGGLSGDWLAGSTVYPLRVAELDDPQQDLAAIVSRVGDAQISFRLVRENPYTAAGETLTMYDGFPVVVKEPNRADDLRVRFERLHEDTDNQIGLPYRRDEAGRAFASQPYNWRAVGRQQHHELRQALYRLNGRQKAVWMPTWNQDVVLARNLVNGSNRLDIQQIGYSYLGQPVSGREHVFLKDGTGTPQIVKITGTRTPLAAGEERLDLSANVGFAASAGTPGSFIELMRLDQDSVEITHYTDSDGVCEAAAAFKAFRSGRDPSGVLVQPTPIATDNLQSCGEPGAGEDSDCTYFAVFEGWYYKAVMTITAGTMRGLIAELYGTSSRSNQITGATYTDTDGKYTGQPSEMHKNGNTYIMYWTNPNDVFWDELFIQQQNTCDGSGCSGTISGKRWFDQSLKPLVTKQSSRWNPGWNSSGGNGNLSWPLAGLFPERYFFAV